MRNAIVEKLRGHLAGPIDTECEVVYLLCEVRKLLDQQQPMPGLSALHLYCNWALHVHLSIPRTTMPLLSKIDAYISDKLRVGDTQEVLQAERDLFREFINLETFREELSQFMAAQGVPTEVCDESLRWHAFLVAYAGVIEDGSLACENEKRGKLKIVESVTFTKGPSATVDGHMPFSVRWDILLKDKRRFQVEVGSQADGELKHWRLILVNPQAAGAT